MKDTYLKGYAGRNHQNEVKSKSKGTMEIAPVNELLY